MPEIAGKVASLAERFRSAEEGWRKTSIVVNQLLAGKGQFAFDVGVAPATFATTILDTRIRAETSVVLVPRTMPAEALRQLGLLVVSTYGSATVYHGSTTAADARFGVILKG